MNSFFSDQTGCPTAGGRALMKLHFKNWSWLHPGPRCLRRLGWAESRFCWVSLHSTQPTLCRCYFEMRNPTTADIETEARCLFSDQTGP